VAFLNTSLIVISGFFLLLGYYFIRQRQIVLHKRSMLTATAFAALFLVVYVTRAALFDTKVFAGEGWIRTVYLAILVSHTILAIVVGPFALVTLRRALRGEYSKHRRIARITFPMWLYVVVTGWLIYWMLHSLSAVAL
jgi:putative membrane protein